MPYFKLKEYTPDIIATPCRNPRCQGGKVGERCRNQWGQDVSPHKVRKSDAKQES